MRVTVEVEYPPPSDPGMFREWMSHNVHQHVELVDHLDTGGFVVRVRLITNSLHAGVSKSFEDLYAWFAEGPAPHRMMAPVGIRATRQGNGDRLAELVGIHEIAELMGVSRQRVAQLKETEQFPQPVARLAMGPVYTRRSVIRFCRQTQRRHTSVNFKSGRS